VNPIACLGCVPFNCRLDRSGRLPQRCRPRSERSISVHQEDNILPDVSVNRAAAHAVRGRACLCIGAGPVLPCKLRVQPPGTSASMMPAGLMWVLRALPTLCLVILGSSTAGIAPCVLSCPSRISSSPASQPSRHPQPRTREHQEFVATANDT
jgi:hypothetical protein